MHKVLNFGAYKKVVVTGGSGFLGKNLMKQVPNWHYVSSKDYDLTKEYETRRLFYELKPDAVIHLAGKVGGIKDNVENQADFYEINTKINTNVVSMARETGVKRLLASLSTCAFPDVLKEYPFKEEDILLGPPAKTNRSYGYTKRSLYIHCLSVREQYGYNYNTFSPSNIYGPGDHFGKEGSHFVASLIYKIATSRDGDMLEFWGTGKPKRQQLYIEDLCKIIPLLLEKHNSAAPIIVAPSENLSIKEMIETGIKISKKNLDYKFNEKLDGQFRKDGENNLLIKTIGEYDFTSFEQGFLKAYKDYVGI